MKKLTENRGETLIESLVSILLVSLIMLFLSTAVATAARVNNQARNTDVSFVVNGEGERQTKGNLTIAAQANGQTQTFHVPANRITTKNGYTYYRYEKGTTP